MGSSRPPRLSKRSFSALRLHRVVAAPVTIPGRLRTQPYVTLALFYVLMFIFGFGTIANFGILARQRSQVMPFLFVLLSLTAAVGPTPGRRGRVRTAHAAR